MTHLSRFAMVFGVKNQVDVIEEVSTVKKTNAKEIISKAIDEIHRDFSKNLNKKYVDLEKILGFITQA